MGNVSASRNFPYPGPGMGKWVDSHCHLQLDERDPADLLERADCVRWVVAPGVDLDSSRAARRLSRRFPGRVRFAAGLHPHEAARWAQERDGLRELMAEADAVGETGLDFYRNLSPRPAQVESFTDHLRAARELGKPLIVHCRDAFREVHDLLESEGAGPRVVLHCWTGGPKWTRRFLELGVTFSFAGPVAFATGDTVRRGAAEVPPERAMVETDTPYLAPPPHRGEPNQPAYVRLVGEALAKVWGMDPSQAARLTSARAEEVFAPEPEQRR